MTNSPTSSVPNTTSRVNHFTGLARKRRRFSLLPANGDGSTLSLDFTTGVLDPRLTFTRSTNATFINSSGLVQYADANMVVNADFVGAGTGNTPTGWVTSAGINLSIPATGVRRAETTTAAQNFIATNGYFTTNTGLTYSTSVQINAVSGQHYANTLAITASPTLVGYYLNGSSVGQYDTAQPGLLTVVWTATGSHGVRVGIGCTGANVANAVCEFTKPRTVPGNFTQPTFFANSSTTAAYHAPRFDYDPTSIGTPQGLLIEGSASTLNQWSEDYTQSYWNKVNTTISNTSVTCPDGVARTTVRVTDNSTSGQHTIRRGIATAAGSTYTLSWFVKRGSTDTFGVQVYWDGTYNTTLLVSSIDNNTQTVTSASGVNAVVTRIAYPTHGWYRYSMTFTHPSATGAATPDINFAPINNLGGYIGTGNHTDFFGIQLELGSGASSYIPTGASTGSRAADSCVMTGTNFSSWFAGAVEGVLYAEFERPRSQSGTIGHDHFAVGSQYASGSAFAVYSAASVYYPTTFLWPTGGAIFPGGIASAIPSVSKQAGKWFNGNDATNFANGVQGTTTAGTGTLTPAMLSIGANSGTGTEATRDWLNACIRRVKFWPIALPDSQIISITT